MSTSKVICIKHDDWGYFVLTGDHMWTIVTNVPRAHEILNGLYTVRLKEWDKGFTVAYSDQAFADLQSIRIIRSVNLGG